MKVEAKGLLGGVVDASALDVLLNKLGSQGWNLVSVFDTNMLHGQSREIVAMFKRETV